MIQVWWTPTNFIARYVIVFVHFEVFATAHEYMLIRMQTGRGHIRWQCDFFQFFQRFGLPETDAGAMRHSQNIIVGRQFNTVWMCVEFNALHFLTNWTIPQSQGFVFGRTDDEFVVATE